MQLTFNGVIAGSIYSLIALGFVLIYRTVKFFHLAHGGVYTAGTYAAYTTFMLLHRTGSGSIIPNLIVATLMGMVVAGVLGVLIDRIVYYPLRKRFASDLILLLASFGVFVFIQNLIQLFYGAQILTMRTWPVKEGYHILGAVITDVQIAIIITSLVVMLILWFLFRRPSLVKQ